MSHRATVAWALARGIDPLALLDHVARGGSQTPAPGAEEPATPAEPLGVQSMLDMTLRELTDRFGSGQGVADWLEVRKTIAEIVKLEMQNAERAGTLIDREFVRAHVFVFIDRSHRQLLGDAPKTIARRVYGLARSDAPLEQAEKVVCDTIGSILQVARDTAARNLRQPTKDDEDPGDSQ